MPQVDSITSTYRTAIVYSQTDSTGQNPTWKPIYANTIKVTNGTGLNQANRVYVVEGTIAASGTATVDVTSGLTDKFGNAIALTRLCEMRVEHLNESANTSTMTVGGGSNPVFATLSVALYKNEDICVRKYSATGLAISTNKNILLTNNSGSLITTYRLTIIGSQ